MKYLPRFLCWFLPAAFAMAAEEPFRFNSNGATLYHLLRIHEPFAGEGNPGPRIKREISDILKALKKNPPENAQEILQSVRIIEDVLLDPQTRGLYQVFLDGIRNSSIKATSQVEGEKIMLQGADAGLIHLKLFEGYQDVYRSISDFNAASPEDHFVFFNDYLVEHGILGFSAYVKKREFTMQMSVRKGTAADLWRSWNLAKSTRKVALGCGALILAFGLGQMWSHPSPSERIQQEIQTPAGQKPPDPQAEADAAAKEMGEQYELDPADGR